MIPTHVFIAVFQEEIDNYGIDWDGPLVNQAEIEEIVDVPELPNISNEAEQELRQLVDPIRESDRYGLDIYMETLQFVQTVLEDT